MGKPKAPHHRGTYHVQAAHIRAMAYMDNTTRCWRCGQTLDEARQTHPRTKWTAGHLIDGQAGGALAAEHSHCNYAAGAAMGNRQRRPHTDLTW